MKESYRLANGNYTSDVKKYVSSYRTLAKPFKALGYVLHSFDPGLRLTKTFPTRGATVDVPIDIAVEFKQMQKLLNENFKPT